ncbi:hypothetical protein MMC10_007027 [Thelotrema lepadinum]|nr:hypothetical protein [Thelotrema lepadinum]
MASSTPPRPEPASGASSSTPSSEKIWYPAACHCKAVQFKALLPPPPLRVCKCNCSACHKLGYFLVYPSKDEVEWIQGYDKLSTYKFGPKIQEHKFCSICGASVGIDSMGMNPKRDVWRLSVRLFKDVDLEKLVYLDFDGKKEIYPEYNEEYE